MDNHYVDTTELDQYEKLKKRDDQHCYELPQTFISKPPSTEAQESVTNNQCKPKRNHTSKSLIRIKLAVGVLIASNVLLLTSLVAFIVLQSIAKQDSCIQESNNTAQQLNEELVRNMTARLIELDGLVKNTSVQLMESHISAVRDMAALLYKSTDSITQLLDAHMNSTRQLGSQDLDTVITLMQNNTQNTLSSLASLTSIDNTLVSVQNSTLITKEIVQNMENSLEVLNEQHKALLSPASCQELKDSYPDSISGYYTINGKEMYCRMGELCGTEGVWTRIAYLDMNDSTVSCPSTLRDKVSSGIRACARPISSGGSCASEQFPSNGISYSEVCGRVVGYQFGTPEATSPDGSIDTPYLEGVSITHGYPRQHIWSLIVGLTETSSNSSSCPCNSPLAGYPPPSFVGNDYFCESGNPTSSEAQMLYPNDPLWDGDGCGGNEANCCSAAGLPWFHKTLSGDTTGYLELRNCGDYHALDEDVYITLYEIYVK